MPPRPRFSADDLLDAALGVTRRDGVAAVSARSVAAELGCSTAPVFRHWSSMEELLEALLDRAIELFVAFLADAETAADPLLAAGLGWVRFAAEEPRLYEALFLTRHRFHFKWGPLRRSLAARMAASPRYQELDQSACFALVGRASIVMHGLGLELWSGRLPALDEPALATLLDQLARPVIDAALAHGWTTDFHTLPPPESDT